MKKSMVMVVVLTMVFASSALAVPWSSEAVKDASGQPGLWTNSGQYPFHDGVIWSGSMRQPLGWAAYDLPGDLVGGTVHSASLEVDVFGCSDAQMGFEAFVMTTDWVEGTGFGGNTEDGVCYMSPDAPNAGGVFNWPGGGGFGLSDVIAGVVATSGVLAPRVNTYSAYDTYTVDAKVLVEQWAAGAANYGIALKPYDNGVGNNTLLLGMDTAAQGGGGYVPRGTVLHIDYTPIPEPVSMVLLGLGALWVRRRI